MRSSHNSFTRAAKHPEKRKIEHIELVKKFISHSPIIEEEIYYEGLLKIAHLFDENEIDFANKEIKKSKEKANKAFSLGAINCFVTNKEQIKR